jgi:hypothetical protein
MRIGGGRKRQTALVRKGSPCGKKPHGTSQQNHLLLGRGKRARAVALDGGVVIEGMRLNLELDTAIVHVQARID